MPDESISLPQGLSHWTAASFDERLATLSAFIDYWHPPSHVQSKPNRYVPSISLPRTLHWLYQRLDSHSDRCFRSNYGGWTEGDPIITYHWIKLPEKLQIHDSEIIEFLNETQGVYQCGVAIGHPDPCVVNRETEAMEWKPQADRLSDFILVLLAFEFSLQGAYSAMGTFTDHDAVHLPAIYRMFRAAHSTSAPK